MCLCQRVYNRCRRGVLYPRHTCLYIAQSGLRDDMYQPQQADLCFWHTDGAEEERDGLPGGKCEVSGTGLEVGGI